MNVLLLTSHYPATDAPARGLYNRHAFGALARHVDLRVVGGIAWWNKLLRPTDLIRVQRERDFGLDAAFPILWSIPRLPVLNAAALTLSLTPYLHRLQKEFPYDAIISTWAYPDCVAAAWFAAQAGCPLIAVVLGCDVNDLPSWPTLRPQIRWGLKQADRVVAVSHALAERVAALGVTPKRIVVQHNAVDGDTFVIRAREQAEQRFQLLPRHRRIIYVGRLAYEKGPDLLLKAVHHLSSQLGMHEVDLFFVGDGPMRAALEAERRVLGLQAQVHFVGHQTHDDIPWWMSAADLLCLPSRREGCPNVVLEALACGRPIVAADVGGLPELVDDHSGILVAPEDPVALAHGLAVALGRLWEPARLRNTVEFLSWDAVGDAYFELLQEVVAHARGGHRRHPADRTSARAS